MTCEAENVKLIHFNYYFEFMELKTADENIYYEFRQI